MSTISVTHVVIAIVLLLQKFDAGDCRWIENRFLPIRQIDRAIVRQSAIAGWRTKRDDFPASTLERRVRKRSSIDNLPTFPLFTSSTEGPETDAFSTQSPDFVPPFIIDEPVARPVASLQQADSPLSALFGNYLFNRYAPQSANSNNYLPSNFQQSAAYDAQPPNLYDSSFFNSPSQFFAPSSQFFNTDPYPGMKYFGVGLQGARYVNLGGNLFLPTNNTRVPVFPISGRFAAGIPFGFSYGQALNGIDDYPAATSAAIRDRITRLALAYAKRQQSGST